MWKLMWWPLTDVSLAQPQSWSKSSKCTIGKVIPDVLATNGVLIESKNIRAKGLSMASTSRIICLRSLQEFPDTSAVLAFIITVPPSMESAILRSDANVSVLHDCSWLDQDALCAIEPQSHVLGFLVVVEVCYLSENAHR